PRQPDSWARARLGIVAVSLAGRRRRRRRRQFETCFVAGTHLAPPPLALAIVTTTVKADKGAVTVRARGTTSQNATDDKQTATQSPRGLRLSAQCSTRPALSLSPSPSVSLPP